MNRLRTQTSVSIDSGRAWLVVAAAFVANFVAFGTLFSFGVFLTPLAVSFDTTTGPIAPLFSGTVCFYYLAGAVGGRLGDRFGVGPIVAFGAVSLSTGLFLASRTTALWQLYLIYVPLVGLGVGSCYAPLIGAVARWFDRQRTMAMSVLLAGVGGGTLVMPSVFRWMIDSFGWRSTMALAAAGVIVLVGAAALVSSTPPDRNHAPALPIRIILRSGRFRRLYVSVVLIGPCFYLLIAFVNDYAIAEGVSGRAAAALVGVSGLSTVPARLVFGAVGDRIGALTQYRAAYGILTSTLLIWLLAGSSYVLLVLAAMLHGIGWAAWVTATPTLLGEWFGVENLGGVIGGFYTGLGFGALAGPAVSGFIIDQSGYRPAIVAVLAVAAIACGVVLRPMDPEQSRHDLR